MTALGIHRGLLSAAAAIAAFFIILFNAQDASSAPLRPYVTSVRHWSNPSYTRIAITLNRKAAYSHRLLKKDPSINKPRRLYIDIKGAALAKNLDKTIEINDGLLKAARAGQYDKDTVRVVLDIESIEDYKVFPLNDPFRIVIDVNGEKAGAPPRPEGPAKPGASDKAAESSESAAAKETSGQSSEAPAAVSQPRYAAKVRPFKIVIDPGHGGKDPGAIGKKGLKEKDVTLKIAGLLKERLTSRLSARIIATRESDVFIPLEERTAIANSRDADIFISIHVNASPRRSAGGVETYILNISHDEEARRVAARENATSRKAVTDLEFILNDLIKTAKSNDSSRLAASVHERLVAKLRENHRDIRSNGVKGAPFYVLVGTRMPSILVEVSFISNPSEEMRLRDEKYINDVVEGIASGVLHYVNGNNRPGVAVLNP